ncbi:hypothetical protein B9479_006087 [Cryptococcus floricola]|uniref:ATP-dependent DNA helicase n=1 Tax=Cryptococcus floricola TaxID=2591691 RepID=A0A5D3ASY3_9TREE|nr:hypothetical protein B9479_006087 [Cryptococcus floricola]
MPSSSSAPIVVSDDSDNDTRPLVAKGKQKAAPSKAVKGETRVESSGALDLDARDALKTALAKLDAEIEEVVDQLKPLQALHTSLTAERRALELQLSGSSRTAPSNAVVSSTGSIDYQSSSFPFTNAIQQTLKNVFSLSSFRLCQQGVINAAVDDRDIVCVMPTGGGKSLTYQLPAVMGRGLTVVVSPLLALIWDQVRGLKEIGIECAMLTGGTSTEEQNAIYARMKDGPQKGEKEIRLVYVTPEKIAKSKRFVAILDKMNQSGRLKRFVIDEAHCCSQLGHDFRPDYKQLSMLKTLFPRVPIQAVTATLSSKTLPDLLKILQLPPITDGRSAKSSGTIFFSAPLFRPNLHYKVIPKPSNAKGGIAAIGAWIQEHHPGQSGIVYCLSKKDAENVSDDLRQWSNGGVKTGVYHAGIDDHQKERIHLDWRRGKINCICATIAFGLGIDKGDVRYVIHHSLSKSLEGFYQETGRAGRDGKDSDCALFYRGQDWTRLAGMVATDVDGLSKLHEMVKFAQDLKTCRKIAFAKYFSASSHLSVSAWDTADTLSSSPSGPSGGNGATTSCGICDNCLRPPDSVSTKDVTLESWKILSIMDEVQRQHGRVTLQNLGSLARGLGGGAFPLVAGSERRRGRGKEKNTGEKGEVDVKDYGGKVDLNADDIEILLTHLMLLGYLKESFHATSFSVNVYVNASSTAIRLSRLSHDAVESGNSPVKIECTFPTAAPKEKKKAVRKKASAGTGKRKKKGDGADDEEEDEDEDEGEAPPPKKKSAPRASISKTKAAKSSKRVSEPEPADDDDEGEDPDEYEAYLQDLVGQQEDQDGGEDDWDEMMGEGWKDDGGWKVFGAGPGPGPRSGAASTKSKGGGRRAVVISDI